MNEPTQKENLPIQSLSAEDFELPEMTVTRRGRLPGRKNKVYQKMDRVIRSTATNLV